VLGESILVTGMTFGEGEASAVTVYAFVVAFLGSVALWWTYFDRTEGLAREVITPSENPGLTILAAYTYSHVLMIAGIIAVAAADELIVAHPGVQGTLASVALTLGRTGLFVAGQALFRWAVSGLPPWSRVVALSALIALAPVGFVMPALARSGLDRRRSRGVGDPWLQSTCALATPVYPVSAGCSPPYSNGRIIHPPSLWATSPRFAYIGSLEVGRPPRHRYGA
jgi:hypothetical protein